MRTEVIRTYLELASLDKLRAAKLPENGACLREHTRMSPTEYIALYSRIGGPWHWRDRLAWTEAELSAYLASPDVHIYTLDVGSENAGYFELVRRDDAVVEIMYFGLDQRFRGRKLGGWMLTRAVEAAFALGGSRVILNTCTLDAPQALPNYLARGFVVTREERYEVTLASPGTAATGTPAP